MERTIEQSAMRKVYLRLLPFAVLTYFFCYIDRINVGFAALTMNKDLGLSASQFGVAAGFFFWGYVIFEVPSNIVMERVGARIWIARIMVTWGILSAVTATIVGPNSFAAVRFLLGVAEAGFFPGIVLFFTYWFPDHHRARIVSGFTVALPIAVAAGAPISTAILGLDGVWGLRGWQLMYIFEAIPTVLLGIGTFFYLTDKPAQARWLTPAEKEWITTTIERERKAIDAREKIGVLQSFWNPKVLLLSINYLGIVTASLGLLIFLPQMVKQLGLTNMQVGWVTMLPYISGGISMVFFGWLSDRIKERRWSLFWTSVMSTIGLVIAGMYVGTWWSVVGMCIAAAGFYGTKGPFWSMPSMFLTGYTAAAAIAFINSVGNLGGFFGPSIVGWAKDATGSFAGGLYALAGFGLVSVLTAAWGFNLGRRIEAAEARAGAD